MAHEIFTAPMSDLVIILDTVTDADSPNSEAFWDAIRTGIESLIIHTAGIAASGSLTSDPSNDANGQCTDSAATWVDDEHNGRTLLFTSGNAKGNLYTIDDTIDSSNRIDCTGDNIYADGARSGDDYRIVYDIKSTTTGHNHDGANSAEVQLPLGRQFCAALPSAQYTTAGGYTTIAFHHVYFPTNTPSYLAYKYQYRVNNIIGAGYTRVAVIGPGGTAYSSATSTSSTSWQATSGNISLSAVGGGNWGYIALQGYHNASYQSLVQAGGFFWNT